MKKQIKKININKFMMYLFGGTFLLACIGVLYDYLTYGKDFCWCWLKLWVIYATSLLLFGCCVKIIVITYRGIKDIKQEIKKKNEKKR